MHDQGECGIGLQLVPGVNQVNAHATKIFGVSSNHVHVMHKTNGCNKAITV